MTSGTAPHGRVSHSATLHAGAIHLFGGSAGGQSFNDYFVLMPPSSAAQRGGARSVGGAASTGKGSRKGAAPARSAVGQQASWTSPEASGFPPEPRFAHTATAIGGSLFIVGGLCP